MRLTISILCCLLLGACKKEIQQYDFIVLGRVPPGLLSDYDNTVVVTDQAGNTLDWFEITRTDQEFSKTIRINEDIKSCNIHLGVHYQGSAYTSLYTYLDVQNAESFAFEPSWFGIDNSLLKQKVVKVGGIQTLDSLGFLGGGTLQTVLIPEESMVFTSMSLFPNQGAVLHGKANGVSEYRYLYLPDNIMSTVDWDYYTSWALFKPAPAARSIDVDELPAVKEVQVDAVFPDFNRFVSIGPPSHFNPADPQFVRPDEVPETLRIRLSGAGFVTEQVFDPGESPEFHAPNMQIGIISSTPGEGFKIETSGDIDLLELTCQETQYYSWKIWGKPASFKDVKMVTLEELSKHIYMPNSYPTPFWRFIVRAHQFGQHNYPEAREGFPYRSDGLFPVARSGYFMLEKVFE